MQNLSLAKTPDEELKSELELSKTYFFLEAF